jgi:hypothetical protein
MRGTAFCSSTPEDTGLNASMTKNHGSSHKTFCRLLMMTPMADKSFMDFLAHFDRILHFP